MKLVVVHPFGGYAKGDEITDAAKVASALKSNPRSVVKVATSDSASTSATSSTSDTSDTSSVTSSKTSA